MTFAVSAALIFLDNIISKNSNFIDISLLFITILSLFTVIQRVLNVKKSTSGIDK